MTITEFLLARIAEDEAVAESLRRKSKGDPWGWQPRGLTICESHRVDTPPARVLVDCEAKRRIVELHEDPHECLPWGRAPDEDCSTLLAVAAIYADHPDHPDYREEWRP